MWGRGEVGEQVPHQPTVDDLEGRDIALADDAGDLSQAVHISRGALQREWRE